MVIYCCQDPQLEVPHVEDQSHMMVEVASLQFNSVSCQAESHLPQPYIYDGQIYLLHQEHLDGLKHQRQEAQTLDSKKKGKKSRKNRERVILLLIGE